MGPFFLTHYYLHCTYITGFWLIHIANFLNFLSFASKYPNGKSRVALHLDLRICISIFQNIFMEITYFGDLHPLRFDAVHVGVHLLTFQRSLLPPPPEWPSLLRLDGSHLSSFSGYSSSWYFSVRVCVFVCERMRWILYVATLYCSIRGLISSPRYKISNSIIASAWTQLTKQETVVNHGLLVWMSTLTHYNEHIESQGIQHGSSIRPAYTVADNGGER